MAFVAGEVQSCQRKEGPSAVVHVGNLPNTCASEFLRPLGTGQLAGICFGLLDPRNKQFIHQPKQTQVLATPLK